MLLFIVALFFTSPQRKAVLQLEKNKIVKQHFKIFANLQADKTCLQL